MMSPVRVWLKYVKSSSCSFVFVGDEAVDRVLAETLHPHLVAVSARPRG